MGGADQGARMPEAHGTLDDHFSEDAFPDSQLSILIPPSPLGIQGGPKKMYASSAEVARAAGLVGDRTHGITILNRHGKRDACRNNKKGENGVSPL